MSKVNLIIIIFIIFINSSCDRTGVADNIYEDKLINQTNKELFMVSSFDVKNDSAYCHGVDSVSLIFIKQVNWSMPFVGPYSIDEGEYPKPIKSLIYNLSDTTYYSSENELTEEDKKVIVTKFKFETRKHIHQLYVTDDFLTLFKKDYTMLDKFKEYYKK